MPIAYALAPKLFPSRVYFLGAKGVTEPVSGAMSWAMMYWRLRYTATWDSKTRTFKPHERVTHVNLLGARAV